MKRAPIAWTLNPDMCASINYCPRKSLHFWDTRNCENRSLIGIGAKSHFSKNKHRRSRAILLRKKSARSGLANFLSAKMQKQVKTPGKKSIVTNRVSVFRIISRSANPHLWLAFLSQTKQNKAYFRNYDTMRNRVFRANLAPFPPDSARLANPVAIARFRCRKIGLKHAPERGKNCGIEMLI